MSATPVVPTYFNIPTVLGIILANQEKIMSALTDVQASEAALVAAVQKAIALLQSLSQQLAAAGTDGAALATLKADMDTQTAALVAEITKDTPAAQ